MGLFWKHGGENNHCFHGTSLLCFIEIENITVELINKHMKKLFLISLLAVAACESTEPKQPNAAYWQRADIHSALYMRGPKAQHQLHKDIAECVTSVKELSRLGSIRDANPPSGIEMNTNLAKDWQSPQGDGPLHAEFFDYVDFESCMTHKGWSRTAYVKPEVMERAKANYNTTILGKGYDVSIESAPKHHTHESNQAYNN